MRYNLLDSIRGAAVISMILYHTMWDVVYIFGQPAEWFTSWPGFIWEQSICWSFILLSGFCQGFAKYSLRDGLVVSAAGLLVTIVSIIFQIGVEIYFGILTFIGAAMLAAYLLKPALKRVNPFLGLSVCLVLFFLSYNFSRGTVGFGALQLGRIPEFFYSNPLSFLTTFLGFPAPDFSSGDYFPFMPWCFLFFFGFFLERLMSENGEMKWLKTRQIPILNFLGRHALIIYLVHQPIIYAILSIIYSFSH